MEISEKIVQSRQADAWYVIHTDGAEIRILFLTDDIVRIRAGFNSDFAEESYSLVMTAWEDRMDPLLGKQRKRIEPAAFTAKEEKDRIILQGRKLRLEAEKEPFRICIYDKDGQCLHADIIDLCYQCDSNGRRIHTSEIQEGDCFYGFGEKTGKINKSKQFMSMSPKDTMGYDAELADSLYKHIPFYVKCNRNTHLASGYFYHTTYECDFDMGREHSNYWKKHSRFRVDGGDIDLFFIAGPSIREVVERYTDLTGKSCMMPAYALGYLGSSMYYSELDQDCDAAIEEFADTAAEEDIPMDGFQLSSGYCVQGDKRYVFTWNRDRFPDPSAFFQKMEKRDITVSPNVKPGFLLTHPLLPELQKKDIFIKNSRDEEDCVGAWWGGKGLFADFTKKTTREVWKKYLKENLLDYGVDSVWNDNCEYDGIVDKDARCDFEGKGGTVGQLKAVMANLMCQVTAEALREKNPDKRPFIVCRSGHAGIQRYAQTWAGDNYTDWKTLKNNIATILGMALCGVTNYGADIGGFYGPAPEAELLVRWVQNGIFQPRFSIHSTNTDNTVTEAWMYPAYTDLIRSAIRFRYQMFPYMYSLMERAHETGAPVLQPMFMAFQQDENTYDNGIDFMMGESLLVANVVKKGQTRRSIYLPAGHEFYDFYTREVFHGGQTIEVPVTLESIPLFIRSGGIIPLAGNRIENLHENQMQSLHLLLAPTEDGAFTLYEDDGNTTAYEQGLYRKSHIQMTAGELVAIRVEKEGRYRSPVQKVLAEVIRPGKAPFWIRLNGQELAHIQHQKRFCEAEKGWYYDPQLQSVQIKYDNPADSYLLEISYEEKDLLGM